MVPSIDTYISLLRAVDRGGLESRGESTWTLTTTGEVAWGHGLSRQKATPLLWSLLEEGYVVRCQQSDSSVTWHLADRGVRLLRADDEIVIQRPNGMARHVIRTRAAA
jgi:hypothetical protein